MALTETEERVSEATAAKVIATLEARGVIPTAETYPQCMSIKAVAALKGCAVSTVRNNWQVWGLRKVGRSSAGFLFSGVSVMRHMSTSH